MSAAAAVTVYPYAEAVVAVESNAYSQNVVAVVVMMAIELMVLAVEIVVVLSVNDVVPK